MAVPLKLVNEISANKEKFNYLYNDINYIYYICRLEKIIARNLFQQT